MPTRAPRKRNETKEKLGSWSLYVFWKKGRGVGFWDFKKEEDNSHGDGKLDVW